MFPRLLKSSFLAPERLASLSRRIMVPVLMVFIVAGCSRAEIEANFTPPSDLWPRWQQHDSQSKLIIDHAAWDRLLKTYIRPDNTGLNRFDYSKVSQADSKALEDYIAKLASLPISRYNKDEQFAYWVNMYNAVTVKVILDHYPVASIRDINDGFLSPGPWDRKLVTVENNAVSLNDIESRILRPIWNDPRIHYAVNCASIGCPNLRKQAFTGANRQTLLAEGAKEYINNPRGVRFVGSKLITSSIYAWFKGDFGGSETAVLVHLKQHATPELFKQLDGVKEIDNYEYDWGLNDAKGT